MCFLLIAKTMSKNLFCSIMEKEQFNLYSYFQYFWSISLPVSGGLRQSHKLHLNLDCILYTKEVSAIAAREDCYKFSTNWQ